MVAPPLSLPYIVTPQTLYTTDDYRQFVRQAETDGDDKTYELIWGEIAAKMPTLLHGRIAARLLIKLGTFVLDHNLGEVFTEANYHLPNDPHNDRVPDLSFIRADRHLPTIEQGSAPFMPDLAVEVKSDGNTYKELREKASYFLHGGARLVWLIYPSRREVEVCTLNAGGGLAIQTVTGADGALSGAEVIPGFSLALKDIFPPEPTKPTEGA